MALAREAADGLSGLSAGDRVDEDVIQVANDYYIRATSARRDDHYRVLKHDDTFAVFDRAGDIQSYGLRLASTLSGSRWPATARAPGWLQSRCTRPRASSPPRCAPRR